MEEDLQTVHKAYYVSTINPMLSIAWFIETFTASTTASVSENFQRPSKELFRALAFLIFESSLLMIFHFYSVPTQARCQTIIYKYLPKALKIKSFLFWWFAFYKSCSVYGCFFLSRICFLYCKTYVNELSCKKEPIILSESPH